MTEEKQNSSEAYRGWGQLIQNDSNDDESTLIFPLTESKTFVISNSDKSDLILPPSIPNANILIHVSKNGKIELENASSEAPNSAVFLNEKELKCSEKSSIIDKMVIKVGPVSYTYQRIETPGSSQLKTLFSSLQCAVCLRFLDNPRSLSCHHMFCQRCVSGLAKAVTNNAPRAAHVERCQPYLSLGIDENGGLMCPVCRKTSSVNETTSARPQKVLTDVSKQLQEIFDGRPICSSCSNQRWMMHGSDYYFCETCQKTLCPLCALDLHRDHKLCSTFETMLQSSRDYINKCAPCKQDWFDVTKEVENNKANVKKTLLWIETFKDQLKQIEQTMENCVKPTSIAWNNVELLEAPRLDDKIETKRTEALKIFEMQIKEARNVLPSMTSSLNIKLSIINIAKAEIEMITANELKSAECSLKEKVSEK